MAALVAENPVGSRGKAVEEALGAQEVDVGEGGEEEQAFDARGKADEIQQERLVFTGNYVNITPSDAYVLRCRKIVKLLCLRYRWLGPVIRHER